jgi:hypothetical protein
MTLDIYSRVRPGMQEDAANRVDAALRAALDRRRDSDFRAANAYFRLQPSLKYSCVQCLGEVAEWLKAPHSKCGIRVTVSGVRIPPSPPLHRSLLYPIVRIDSKNND